MMSPFQLWKERPFPVFPYRSGSVASPRL
jgi:hypothetical protein